MKRMFIVHGLVCVGLLGCSRPSRVAVEGEAAAAPPAHSASIRSLAAIDEPNEFVGVEAVATFSFPDDAGGRLLAAKLTPAQPPRMPAERKTAPRLRASSAADRADIPLPPAIVPLPRLPMAKVPSLRPHGLAESVPLEFFSGDLDLPGRPDLPPAILLAQRTPERREPPLPMLSKPVADRASLEDPTVDFSIGRAVAEPVRMRSTRAPFQRYDLPEIVEHRAESTLPATEPPVVAPVPAPPK